MAITYIDLLCGIGGFSVAANKCGWQGIFASDIDKECVKVYQHNFGILPMGDITTIDIDDIPFHDVLFAGLPCQPFSIIGNRRGYNDKRGMLFFDVLRIIKAKLPRIVVLENVKQFVTIHNGVMLKAVIQELTILGYRVDYKILNTLDYGLPHKRERIFIVAMLEPCGEFCWSTDTIPMKPLSEILEENPDTKHFVSERIRQKRHDTHTADFSPAIWHENKSGHISSHAWSCALRAGASYNYLLVDGERRLTPRELLRLQGFPDSFEIISNDSQVRKQVGNAVSVPVVESVINSIIGCL